MSSFRFLSRHVLLLIAVYQINLFSYGQHHPFTGFFIDPQGDTVRGTFPQYRQWNYNPESVAFQVFSSGKVMELSPRNCRMFHINGYDTYVSFSGNRLTNPIEFGKSKQGSDPDHFQTITGFLRVIGSTSAFTFYIFKDQQRINMYYSGDDGRITELLQKASIIENTFWQSMTYKDQLKTLFPGKGAAIDHLLYTESSLISLIRKEDTFMGTTTNKASKKTGLFISGGIALNSIRFHPVESLDFSTKDYPSTKAPLISIGYLVPFSRNFSRAFFLPELKVFSFKQKGSRIFNGSYPSYSNTFQSSPVISLGVHIGYDVISHPDIKVSIASGGGFDFLLNNRQVDENKFSASNSILVKTEMDHLAPFVDVQAIVTVKKKYMLWSAYNLPTGVTIYQSAGGKLRSIQFGLGYLF